MNFAIELVLVLISNKYVHSPHQPPIVPAVSHDGDARNFDDYPELEWNANPATIDESKLFDDF